MDSLSLFVPKTIYNRYNNTSDPVMPSPFVLELPYDSYVEMKESYAGGLEQRRKPVPTPSFRAPSPVRETPSAQMDSPVENSVPKSGNAPEQLGFCLHKIFGRGKIIARIEPNKYRVNFPGFGLKVIIEDYLELL